VAKCARCGSELAKVARSCSGCSKPLCASCRDIGPTCGAHLDPVSVAMQYADELKEVLRKLSPDEVTEIRGRYPRDPSR
jgi:predicted amidophosphoribosyltransferase